MPARGEEKIKKKKNHGGLDGKPPASSEGKTGTKLDARLHHGSDSSPKARRGRSTGVGSTKPGGASPKKK